MASVAGQIRLDLVANTVGKPEGTFIRRQILADFKNYPRHIGIGLKAFCWVSDAATQMTLPLVSVIVPIWNGQDELTRCLETVLGQDYDQLEVLVIDDASTDRSLNRIREVASAQSRIRVITHRENQGLGSTLNHGIQEAKGQFILVVHQDCEMLDSFFIRKAVETLLANADIGAVTGRRVYKLQDFSPNEKLFMVANGHLAELDHNGFETQELTFVEDKCDLYPRSVLESVGGFPAEKFRTSGEDQILSSRIRGAGYRLVKLGHITYRLGFGKTESSLKGILAKLRVYGRTQAGVLVTIGGSALSGVSGAPGLLSRAMNRIQMIVSASTIVVSLALSIFWPSFLLLTAGVFLGRCLTYLAGLGRLRGRLGLALLGPIVDIFYSIGFLEGLAYSSLGRRL